jgi:nucleotide-binding universal stress UspA family protein/predicted transcriptional regulator
VQRTLLVPLDGSEVSESALPWATTLAQAHGLSITLARVAEYPLLGGGTWPEDVMTAEAYEQVIVAAQDEAEQYLNDMRQRLAGSKLRVDTVVRHGNPSVALLDLADELNAAAIVIASHGRGGFKRFVLGSVAMQLVSHTAVPVFLVRATTSEHRRTAALHRLLVPLDGSVLASRALEVAREIATAGTTLVLVRVVPWPRSFVLDDAGERPRDAEATAYGVGIATDYLDRMAAPLRAAGLSVETQVVVSETTDTVSRHLAVAAAAWNVDAVVMSTHGHGGVTGWLLGSVADQVVRNVDRPVLLVSVRALAARATGQMCVGDVMTRDVLTLQEDETLIVALRKLVRRQASGAPVLDVTGRLVGVVSQRDVMGWYERTVEALAKQSVPSLDEYLRRLRSERVRAVMTTTPTSIQESASLGSALSLLQARRIHRLPVTREGRVVGILTGSDVLLALLAQIETTQEGNRRTELQPAPAALSAVRAEG